MKNKNTTIRSILGISQEELAQLLQIPRAQVSMFECGKRDLPREAKIALAPMLAHVTKTNLKFQPQADAPDPKKQESLAQLLQENELQRLSNARKLHNAKEQYEKNTAVLNLTDFLADTHAKRPEHCKPLAQVIKARAKLALLDCDATALMKYEIKAELLELEKLLLEEYSAKNTTDKAVKK